MSVDELQPILPTPMHRDAPDGATAWSDEVGLAGAPRLLAWTVVQEDAATFDLHVLWDTDDLERALDAAYRHAKAFFGWSLAGGVVLATLNSADNATERRYDPKGWVDPPPARSTDAAADPPGGLDVIGDVHGHASRLVRMLKLLGYRKEGRAWRHTTRRAVFVGDLIDRGPQQLETVRIVRAMVEAGSAEVVMGNHEFNAIAFATLDPTTLEYCRTHDDKHEGQHRAFLSEVGFDTPLHRAIIDWFRTLPLWLELDGLRIVHACWSERHLDVLRRRLGGPQLTDDAVIEGTRKQTELYDALEVVLKGPEIDLGGVWYPDKEGHRRYRARLRWWDPEATSLPAAMMVPADTTFYDRSGVALPRPPIGDVSEKDAIDVDPTRPVLFGHYWWRHDTAEPIRPGAACLDFSVAADGVLAAYRWNRGDTALHQDRLVTV